MNWREQFDHWFALFSGKENACGKKHQYQSPVLATKAAYNLEVKYPGEYFDVYRCPWCEFYHIGHAVDPEQFEEFWEKDTPTGNVDMFDELNL